jgi:nucleoredoxin
MLRALLLLLVVGFTLNAVEQRKESSYHQTLLEGTPLLFDQTGNRPQPRYLSYLSRQKYVLLYFGSSKCEPCKKFTPELITWYNTHGGGKDFEVILVGSEFDNDSTKAYMKTAGMPWLAFEWNEEFGKKDAHYKVIQEKYGSKYVPTLVLLDENDAVVARSNDGDQYLGTDVVLKKYLALTKGK